MLSHTIDFTGPPPTDVEMAAALAEAAAHLLRRHGTVRLDSAAWRLADALHMLAQVAAAEGIDDVPGIDHPTGLQRAERSRSGGDTARAARPHRASAACTRCAGEGCAW